MYLCLLSFLYSLLYLLYSYSQGDEMEEVPGSVHYIQANGQLNYGVILLAAHSMAGRRCTAQISGLLLSILNCLLDLGLIKKEKKKKPEKEKEDSSTSTEQGILCLNRLVNINCFIF